MKTGSLVNAGPVTQLYKIPKNKYKYFGNGLESV